MFARRYKVTALVTWMILLGVFATIDLDSAILMALNTFTLIISISIAVKMLHDSERGPSDKG